MIYFFFPNFFLTYMLHCKGGGRARSLCVGDVASQKVAGVYEILRVVCEHI
jgi:hypothetical protein